MLCHCRVMLSDKLLSKTDYNCDREIRTLELLKLRFGDANLHNCEASGHLHCSCCTQITQNMSRRCISSWLSPCCAAAAL